MVKRSKSKEPDAAKEKAYAFQARCRQMGLKVTPQRMAVYNALIATKEHPSAEIVYRQVKKTFPSISLDTVNRTLLTLDSIGVAFAVEGSGDPRRYDGNLQTHQHFKCIKCKRIIDFHHKPFENIPIPRALGKRFTILRKTVYFEGICDLCERRLRNKRFSGEH